MLITKSDSSVGSRPTMNPETLKIELCHTQVMDLESAWLKSESWAHHNGFEEMVN